MSGLKCDCLQPAGWRGWVKAACAADMAEFYSVLHQLQVSKATFSFVQWKWRKENILWRECWCGEQLHQDVQAEWNSGLAWREKQGEIFHLSWCPLQNEGVLFSFYSYDSLACSWLYAASYENFFSWCFSCFLENICCFMTFYQPEFQRCKQ